MNSLFLVSFVSSKNYTHAVSTRRVGGKSITKSTRGSARVERISGFRTACVAQTADKISAPQRDQIINISQPENVHKNARKNRPARHQSQLRRRYHRDKTRNYRVCRDLDTQSKEHTNDISIYFNSARLSRLAFFLFSSFSQSAKHSAFPRGTEQCDHLHFAAELKMKESHRGEYFAPPLVAASVAFSARFLFLSRHPLPDNSRLKTNCENYGNFYQLLPSFSLFLISRAFLPPVPVHVGFSCSRLLRD